LEPLTPANEAEFAEIQRSMELSPAMGPIPLGSSEIAPPMLVRALHTGRPVGLVQNQALPGKVAVFVIFLDPKRSRRGYGLEAVFMYISHLFDSGARLVGGESVDFNVVLQQILHKVGIEPRARMREHVYRAGAFRDLVIFSFGETQWRGIVARYRRSLPGGSGRPAVFGGGRAGG